MSSLSRYHYNSRGKMFALVTLLVMATTALTTNHAALALDPLSSKSQASSVKLNQSVALNTEDTNEDTDTQSNQSSVSVDESVKRRADVDTGVDASAGNVGIGSAFSGNGASTASKASPEYLPPRGTRNIIRASVKTLPVADKSTPWYSSGIGAMAIVFVAIGMVYFLVRKYMPGSIIVPCQGVKVIGRVALSPKHRAVLVKLGDRAILIGLGGDQMTTLAEITDRDEVARLSQETNLGTAAKSPEFNSWLRREQEDYGLLEDAESMSEANHVRSDRRSPMGDLLDKLRSFQKTSSRK